MKKFNRALAMGLVLALLLSFSPALGVNAAEADNTYNQLMHDYKPTGLTYDLTDNTNYATISGTTGAISATDSTHLLFDNYPTGNSAYVTLRNQQTGITSIILEFDFCYEDAGLRIDFTVNGANFKFANFAPDKNDADIKRLTFQGSNSQVIEAGKWYKLTLVCNVASKTSIKFDGYIDKVLVADDVTFTNSNKTISQITTVRAQVNSSSSNTNGENGDFQIRNVNWYIPNTDENKCTDANDDHVCDYDIGCELVSECADADNDGYCDYSGCGKRTVYNVTKDNEELEITASGVLNMNGYDATVKVTGDNTVLSVVDTAFMTDWNLTGEMAGKLTVTEGAEKIENWTQYGEYKYLAVYDKETNTYSAHPFNLTIDKIGVNTYFPAVAIRTVFIADDTVAKLIDAGEFGLHNHTADSEVEVEFTRYDKKEFVTDEGIINGIQAYFYLEGSLGSEVLENNVSNTFSAYIKLDAGNGEITIDSLTKPEISPKGILEDLNAKADSFSADQQAKVVEMLAKEENAYLKEILTNFAATEE